jgi:DNA-binding response OmpR family regulator
MRVLVVEDDKPVADFVRRGLEAEQYAVDVAQDGEEGRRRVRECDYDLLVLDLNLPRTDGFEVLRSLRARNASTPVLILTVRTQVEERVKGLDLGADDYLPKPFAFAELAARVRALLRRSDRSPEVTLRAADLELNRVTRTVIRGGREIGLTRREFALLEYLLRNQGRCVTRAMVVQDVWHYASDTLTNVVDVYINYLRTKVDKGFEAKLIHTIRGVGYQLSEMPEEEEAA